MVSAFILKTMQHTQISGDLNLTLVLILTATPFILLILKHLTCPKASNSELPLPPGPRPWPIIGNIFQLGKKPHISMTHLAQLHGPLISLRIGTRLAVIGSSPAAAAEILKTHDFLLSARSIPDMIALDRFDLTRLSIMWSHCNDHWRSLRALCHAELFSRKALESTAVTREKKAAEMVEFLDAKRGQVVSIAQIVSTTAFNSITSIFMSEDFCHYEEDDAPSRLKEAMLRGQKLGSTLNLADLFPVLARFDLQGLKKKALELTLDSFALWEDLIKERRRTRRLKHEDFLDVLLDKGFSDDQINYLFIELLSASTDTTTSTVEWAMAELLKNKEVMAKVRQELSREMGQDSIKESKLSGLPYLLACVMETLRLHPPGPILLPHLASKTCQVMNYTIPQGTQVFVNFWAIGRDPVAWEDPLSFKPERFVNYQGQDFNYLPFGSGRRMCPGHPMATKQVALLLAHLVYAFDWSLPNDEDPAHLDMTELFGIALRKQQPLCAIPL